MQQTSIPLVPPKDTMSGAPSIGFLATMLRVENPTPAYWYLPDSLRYIPPFHTGIAIPIIGTEQARILFQAPAGVVQNVPVGTNPGTAYFTYTDEETVGDSGVNLGGSAFGRTVKSKGPFIVGAGATLVSDIFATPSPDGIWLYALTGSTYNVNQELSVLLTLPGAAQNIILGIIGQQIAADNLPHLILRSRVPIPALSVLTFSNTLPAFIALLLA